MIRSNERSCWIVEIPVSQLIICSERQHDVIKLINDVAALFSYCGYISAGFLDALSVQNKFE